MITFLKKLTLGATLSITFMSAYGQDQGAANYVFKDNTRSVNERIDDLLKQMTVEEKIDLLAGYQDFYLHPCTRLNIPAFKMADGPLGVSSWGLHGKATAFPSSLSVAASWDREMAAYLGKMYAQEWRARGIHFILAPGVNHYRASKGARNFEYYGEDPYLTSQLIVPFIKSVQDGGVIATVKHYAVNDQEYDRYKVSSEIDQRTLREIYLPAFEAAVKEAGVKAVMTGYNPVNGVYCTEHKELIDILKKEWAFTGMLMSDWACTYSADKAANHGLDLEMGSKSWFNRDQLLPLIANGTVPMEVIDDKVRRIYGTCMEMGFFDRSQQDINIPTFNPQANTAALQAARDGIILLKNDNNTLPLKHARKIAVIGPTALPNQVTDRVHNVNSIHYGGGGSSKVHPWYVVSILEGMMRTYPDAEITYHQGISNQFKNKLFERGGFVTPDGKPGLQATYTTVSQTASQGDAKLINEQLKAAGQQAATQNAGAKSNTQQLNETKINNEWWSAPHGLNQYGDHFAATWQGFLPVQQDGNVHLFVDAQGAYRLFVDNKEVIDASQSSSFHFGQATIQGQKGERKHIRLEFDNRRSIPAEIRLGYCYDNEIDFSEPLRLAKQADAVLFCGGFDGVIEREGRDRPFELPFGQDSLINQLAKVNPNTVVALVAGGGVDMSAWINNVPAVLHALYPGQEGGTAVAEIVKGLVNPSAKLPFTIERCWTESPTHGNYDETRHTRKVHYNEGIFTGYRGYDKHNTTPLFPFGHGLSYTQFAYSDLKVEQINRKQAQCVVSFTVTNTGKEVGKEVAQLYVTDVKSKEPRPIKELKAFDKITLRPGESKRISIPLDEKAFRYFSAKKNAWVTENGTFKIAVGGSSQSLPLTQEFVL
ncbi:MAG: glycoside hydrolase family 3 protein [Marinifilaceae bacterium]